MTDQQGGTFIVHYKTIEQDDTTDDDLSEGLVESNATPQDQHEQNQNQPQQPHQPQHNSQHQQINHQPPPNIGDDAQKEMINAFVSGVQCLKGVWNLHIIRIK